MLLAKRAGNLYGVSRFFNICTLFLYQYDHSGKMKEYGGRWAENRYSVNQHTKLRTETQPFLYQPRWCTNIFPLCGGNIDVHSTIDLASVKKLYCQKKGLAMDRIKIEDSMFLLKYACEDLRVLRSVIQSLESQADCLDVLAVVIRALGPIIGDIRNAVDTIGGELEKEKNDAAEDDGKPMLGRYRRLFLRRLKFVFLAMSMAKDYYAAWVEV